MCITVRRSFQARAKKPEIFKSSAAHFPNPTNAVGGSFILSLQRKAGAAPVKNPTNAVGGLFILSVRDKARLLNFHRRRWKVSSIGQRSQAEY